MSQKFENQNVAGIQSRRLNDFLFSFMMYNNLAYHNHIQSSIDKDRF